MSANSTVSCFSFLKRPGETNLHKIYRLNGKDSKNEEISLLKLRLNQIEEQIVRIVEKN